MKILIAVFAGALLLAGGIVGLGLIAVVAYILLTIVVAIGGYFL